MTRKGLFLLISLLAGTLMAMAAPVSQEQARQQAADFLSGRGPAFARGNRSLKAVATSGDYYVFNIGSRSGFVIVGGDDALPGVIGYAEEGAFDGQNLPDNMRAWLRGYADQAKAAAAGRAKAAPRRTVTGSTIEPLTVSAWNQNAPYNGRCPTYKDIDSNTQHSFTGCVATAMAQVMYCHRYPTQTAAVIPSYTAPMGTIAEFGITTIDWDNMLPSYNGKETQAQQDAVATLMALCGAAVQAGYNRSASTPASTWNMHKVLRTYFGYDSGMKTVDRGNYRAAQWNQMIYDELAAQRPVIYSGQSSGGGHSFVVDGYGGDDYFHVNWGWGGMFNGYFLLSVLDSGSNSGIGASHSTDGYSYGQDATIGIQPPTGAEPAAPVIAMTTQGIKAVTKEGDEYVEATTATRTDAGTDFTLQIAFTAWNLTGETRTFDLGVGVYDKNDQLIKAVTNITCPLDQYSGFDQSSIWDVAFGAGLPDGTYKLIPISRVSGEADWQKDFGYETNHITAVIAGNTLTLTPFKEVIDLSGTITPTGKTTAGLLVPLELTVTNNGTDFNREVFLLVNKVLKGGKYLDVDAGETVTLSLGFIPNAAGDYTVEAAYKVGVSYVPIASRTVTVSAAAAANLAVSMSAKNATGFVVKEPKLVIAFDVTNNGTETYDNLIAVKLFKLIPDTNKGTLDTTRQQELELAAGASKSFEVTFDGLEDGAEYFFYAYYYSAGESVEIPGSGYGCYKVQVEATPTVKPGDANGDGKVDANDIACIVNYLNGTPSTDFNEAAADVNGDGKVDTADIVCITNIITAAE